MKKILSIILAFILPMTALAAPAFTVSQGGTGTGTPWSLYPLAGNGSSPLQATSTPWLVGVNATGTSDLLASTFVRARITFGTTTYATSTAFFATTASTTNLFGANLGACSGSNFLQWTAGLFGCAGVAAYPFTTATNYAGTVSATGTPIWGQAGIQASSTSYFANLIAVNSTTTSATTTTLYVNSGGITTTGSTTLQNFTFKLATGTSATTTNFFSTTASSTNLFTQNLVANITTYPSFGISTSTPWTGTTTKAIGPAVVIETWVTARCFTDAGTVNISINDGTNRMDMIAVTTAVGTTNFTVNNVLTAGTKRYIDIGTPASSPTQVSCTFKKTVVTN